MVAWTRASLALTSRMSLWVAWLGILANVYCLVLCGHGSGCQELLGHPS